MALLFMSAAVRPARSRVDMPPKRRYEGSRQNTHTACIFSFNVSIEISQAREVPELMSQLVGVFLSTQPRYKRDTSWAVMEGIRSDVATKWRFIDYSGQGEKRYALSY